MDKVNAQMTGERGGFLLPGRYADAAEHHAHERVVIHETYRADGTLERRCREVVTRAGGSITSAAKTAIRFGAWKL